MDPLEAGCLTQRSQLEQLREIADGWAKDRLTSLTSDTGSLATSLIVLRAGAVPRWDAQEIGMLAAEQTLMDWHAAAAGAGLAQLIPFQTIMRILRDQPASAAALIAPIPSAMVALQIADFDHEESLTARIIQQPDASPTLGKWDFGNVPWTVRLRQMLRGARIGTQVKAARSAVTVIQPGAPKLVPSGPSRRHHVRELREQLGREAAPAPSWLQ